MVRVRMTLANLLMLTIISGCASTAQVINKGGPTIAEAQAMPTIGEKLRIAVIDFENRTSYDVGRGMRAMLTSALFHSSEFIVLEREELSDVLLEQQLGMTGVVSAETAPPVGEVEGAQILIYGVVTDFEPGQRGATTIAGGAQQSHVAIDIRIVDSRTSRVLATTTVEGKATDAHLGTSRLTNLGMTPLYSLDIWENTPVGTAIRLCIDEAVGYIVTQLR